MLLPITYMENRIDRAPRSFNGHIISFIPGFEYEPGRMDQSSSFVLKEEKIHV